MTIYISANLIERHLENAIVNRMLLDNYSISNKLSDRLSIHHPDIQSIFDKLDLDAEFSHMVKIPPKHQVMNKYYHDLGLFHLGQLTKDQIQERYTRSLEYINQVLDFRNPPLGQKSEIDALIHGGFHLAPKLC